VHEAWVFVVEFGFKVHRRLEAAGAVEPLAVVKDFDPFKDRRACVGARGEAMAMNQFAFHGAPEAFHHGVVVAVAAPAHAWNDARQCQPLPITFAGILDAPVGMMHQTCWRLTMSVLTTGS